MGIPSTLWHLCKIRKIAYDFQHNLASNLELGCARLANNVGYRCMIKISASVQDWSLQCPSNAIWPFKIYLCQNNSSKCNPKLKMKTSLEVILHIVLETCTIQFIHKFNTRSIFLDWRLGFELALQLKGWNLRALQNETHMRASIVNID